MCRFHASRHNVCKVVTSGGTLRGNHQHIPVIIMRNSVRVSQFNIEVVEHVCFLLELLDYLCTSSALDPCEYPLGKRSKYDYTNSMYSETS
jgi:hypothetical protein